VEICLKFEVEKLSEKYSAKIEFCEIGPWPEQDRRATPAATHYQPASFSLFTASAVDDISAATGSATTRPETSCRGTLI
jgi:hypothetical protein